MFKNCVSVASTVTSIILSVIAIILSVTGERTTNEIRNKVSDSVGQLEACTTKSSGLAEELTATLQQLNQLYSNINEKILNPMHLSEEGLKSHITQNEDFSVFEKDYIEKKAESISGFLNVLPIQTRQGVKNALKFMQIEMQEKHNSIKPEDIMNHLLSNGVNANLATLVVGLTLGYLSSGALNYDGLEIILEKINSEE